MTVSLGSQDEAKLDRASAAAVVEHLHRIEGHFSDGRWLGRRNVYRKNPVVAIGDRNPGSGRDRPLQLGDYVAASCPLHLWDGWNYLGLAVHSHLCGSVSNAIHLAYYAELRAAMSLLASQGIGIFSRKHCVIDKPGSVLYLSNHRTHDAARLYLEYWADKQAAAALLSQVLRMEGRPIDEWVLHLRQAGSWTPVGADLLRQAGLDLARMSDDRDARNEASYRPTGIVPLLPRTPTDDASFLLGMIHILEPGGSPGSFETLDRFLSRRIIESAYSAGSGRLVLSGFEPFERAVESMVGTFIDHPMRRAVLEQFLTRKADELDPRLIVEANRDGNQLDHDYHVQVLSRATLLLRFATGATREALRSADIDLDSLHFWWNDAGNRQGIWDKYPSSVNASDLWIDIDAGLDDIYAWMEGDSTSRHGLLVTCAESVLQLANMARFTLIGLAS